MANHRTEANVTFVEPLVSSLREMLERSGISVEKVILFGSFAHGVNTDASDIDVAIVSSAFTGVRFQDMSRIIDAVPPINSRLEIHPFRPDEFDGNNPFASEILRSGIVLYDAALFIQG